MIDGELIISDATNSGMLALYQNLGRPPQTGELECRRGAPSVVHAETRFSE
jgi:hypothetical protein